VLVIDGVTVPLTDHCGVIHLQADGNGNWIASPPTATSLLSITLQTTAETTIPFSGGRIQAILNSPAPLTIVVPDASLRREFSVALRIAQALNVYHRLDIEIVESSEALKGIQDGALASRSIVVVGNATTPFVKWVLERKETPFDIENESLRLRGRSLTEPGRGKKIT
jgi:hypothetical protein